MFGEPDIPRPEPDRALRACPVTSVAIGLILVACASAGSFRETNLDNLDRLRTGMSRNQVFDVMGTESVSAAGTEGSGPVGISEDTLGVNSLQVPIGGPRPVLQNPHRNEVYETAGSSWEVLFYYTRVIADDGLVTDDELTPVVLRDGTLVGIGWEYWTEQASMYAIPASIPATEVGT
jgi:hypothetical protein